MFAGFQGANMATKDEDKEVTKRGLEAKAREEWIGVLSSVGKGCGALQFTLGISMFHCLDALSDHVGSSNYLCHPLTPFLSRVPEEGRGEGEAGAGSDRTDRLLPRHPGRLQPLLAARQRPRVRPRPRHRPLSTTLRRLPPPGWHQGLNQLERPLVTRYFDVSLMLDVLCRGLSGDYSPDRRQGLELATKKFDVSSFLLGLLLLRKG